MFPPRNPFSQQFRDYISSLRVDLDAVLATVSAATRGKANAYGRIPFKITAVGTTSSSYPIWTYSGTQQTAKSSTGTDDDWQNMTSAITASDTMVNDLEYGNTSTSAYGYAVTYTGGQWKLSTAPFTASVFKPVPTGRIVWCKPVVRPDGTLRYHFSAPNPIEPGCEEA